MSLFRLTALALSCSILVWLALACDQRAQEPILSATPPAAHLVEGLYRAAQPDAPLVTVANLHASERFWPHQIQLTSDWKPEGWEGEFGWGMGVLIRVSEDRRLRVDFSRFGKHWIPVEATDVLERANAIRVGDGHKYAPNLVLALRNRLLDPTSRTLEESDADLFAQRAFLLVFADPRSPEFARIAESLAPLAREDALHMVLLPEGEHADAHVFKACFEAGWQGSFLLDRFVPAYSEGFLDTGIEVPHVQLVTPEGRIVWQAAWSPSLVERARNTLARSQ